jgi:hypothetical protein
MAARSNELAFWRGQHPAAVPQQTGLSGKRAGMAHAPGRFQGVNIEAGKPHIILSHNTMAQTIKKWHIPMAVTQVQDQITDIKHTLLLDE